MTGGAHVSPTQMIMLQGRSPCCPSQVTSAADRRGLSTAAAAAVF